MSELIRSSLFWRLCAALCLWFRRSWLGKFFAALKRTWCASGTYRLFARLLTAPSLAERSRLRRFLDRQNRKLRQSGRRRKEYMEGSLFCRALGAAWQKVKESFFLGALLKNGVTAVLLVLIAAYAPIDYVLREIVCWSTLASVWDELLIVFCVFWIVRQRMTAKKPMHSRLTSLDLSLVLYILCGLALLTYCYADDCFGINFTGFRASMQYILLFFLVTRLIRDERDFLLMYKVMIAIAFLVALYGIWQFIVGVEIPSNWTDKAEGAVRTRVFAIFPNPNIMGAYMILFAPMAIGMAYATDDLATKVFYWFCGLCMCLGCLFTMSRGAWLGLAVAAVLFALVVDRRLFAMIVCAAVVACFLPFVRSRISYLFTDEFKASNEAGGRAKRWSTAMSYLDDYDCWDVGLGYGMYGGAVAMQNQINPEFMYKYVDNYYVKILAENGIIGLSAFLTSVLGLIWNGARACGKTAKTPYLPLCVGMLAGLIGVLVQSFFESIWEEPYMMALFFAIAGMLIYVGFFRRLNRFPTNPKKVGNDHV